MPKEHYHRCGLHGYERKLTSKKIIGAVLRLLHSEHHASSTTPIHVNCIYKGK
nr:MAG TPA: hypothetical protein [Caudoviricetes sp.]